tara:strand:+ start:953 stop:1330 length:378 start_codon:yes stop_codon:yes gene_type:complete
MSTEFEKVLDFQKKVLKSNLPSRGVQSFTKDFEEKTTTYINEEVAELTAAFKAQDKAEIADALIDIIYFSMGAIAQMGVPFHKAFDDVHKANMSKKKGIKTERGLQGDATKPAKWVAPDLNKYFK